jgi:hypothetical protein
MAVQARPSDELADEKGNFNTHETVDEEFAVLEDERDFSTHIITVADDETLNPWTCRVLILSLGLSGFGAVLGR